MTATNKLTPADLERRFRELTARFTQRCIEAQQALIDLESIKDEIDDLVGTNSRDGLPGELVEHVERIGELNLGDMIAELLAAEQIEAEFMEDGSAPTPPVGFVDEETPTKRKAN